MLSSKNKLLIFDSITVSEKEPVVKLKNKALLSELITNAAENISSDITENDELDYILSKLNITISSDENGVFYSYQNNINTQDVDSILVSDGIINNDLLLNIAMLIPKNPFDDKDEEYINEHYSDYKDEKPAPLSLIDTILLFLIKALLYLIVIQAILLMIVLVLSMLIK